MAARLVRASGLYSETGYACAAIAAPGSLVFAAGACPIDEHGKVVGGADYAPQARQMMANLGVALAEAGAGLSEVLKVYVASSDRRDLVTVWDVVRAAFGEHEPPSTLLGVSVCKETTECLPA